MKRGLALSLLVVFTAACSSAPPTLTGAPESQVLVILHDDGERPLPVGSKRGYRGDAQWPVSLHTLTRARNVARDHGLTRVYAWPVPQLRLFCVVFRVPAAADRARTIDRLRADPRIARVQNVNVFQGMLSKAYDDPLLDLQYGAHKEELESAHAVTTGRGVRIGIIDSNVDALHEDLRGQISAQYPPANERDPETLRHGTAVAGVIAAAGGNGTGLVGLAPGATVSIYAGCRTIVGDATRCTTVSLAEAIQQAVDDRSDIINMSLAGPRDWLLAQLLSNAHRHGAVLVAAYSPDRALNFPGSLPFVHAVPPDAGPWFARAEQFSTRAGGGYQVFSGSSMSAAGVTGVAALLRTRWSGAQTEAVLDTLLNFTCQADGTEDAPLQLVVDDEPCVP